MTTARTVMMRLRLKDWLGPPRQVSCHQDQATGSEDQPTTPPLLLPSSSQTDSEYLKDGIEPVSRWSTPHSVWR
jgi:hypothetical protein